MRTTLVRKSSGCALLLAGLLGAVPPSLHADSAVGMGIGVGFTADDNVTRGFGDSNIRSDRIVNMNLSQALRFRLADHWRVLLSGFAGLDAYQDYQGLSHFYAGAQGELQYRPAGTFGAPIYGLYARASMEEYESTLRDSYRYAVGLSARKPLTDRVQVFGALAWNLRDGRSEVFDNSDFSLRFNADYAATRRDTVYLGLEYRDGDIVSTAQPSLAYVGMSTAIVEDDVFTDATRYSYRLDGTTWIATLGYNRALGERHSLDLSWRHARATPDSLSNAAYSDSSIEYTVNQISLAYMASF
jgi:hypothetical protein